MRHLGKYIFISGLVMLPLSVIMFVTGVGMFTAKGNFPQFFIRWSELSFVLWLPFLLAGIVFIITGVIMYFSHQKNQTNTNQQQ
ncbi:hypothetical protein BBI00_10215 [Chryseobacterium arthrosphaerae]|uniref:Uncharacterized protein n=1 Tax=Chryseobacterium arthrosphaerae TaxID=651561 RepID=A0A1B8ZSW9_9FLAO|nr:hypothetical protein BBI00_10215 [Chryseobacterium arthrosphaerae]